MRKLLLTLVILLVPTVALAQGALQVSGVVGNVEWKAINAARFSALQPTTAVVHAGDQIRTIGDGSAATLTLADGSYMVVSANSTVTIQEFWAPTDFRTLVNVALGRVRFYIQKFGGRPNPYNVKTPTALIAVRGTTFDVIVDDARQTEVVCLEGRVGVISNGVADREVILDQGWKTFVRAGAAPIPPVPGDEEINKNRVFNVVLKNVNDPAKNGKDAAAAVDALVRNRDNDRRNGAVDPLRAPGSTTTTDTQRAKPTLKFPEN